MRTFLRAALLVPALVAGLTSCASFRFDGQDVGLRHDAKADSAELCIVYHGIRSEDDDSLKALERIARGHRTFVLYDWPFEVDIEGVLAKPMEEPGEGGESPEAALERRGRAYLEGVSVEASGFFKDENGLPCAYQRLRFPNAQAGLDLLNEAMLAEAPELEGLSADPNASIEDQFSYAYAKAAHEKRDLCRLVDGVLEVHIPATPAIAADVLHEIVMNPAQQADPYGQALKLVSGLTAALGELRVTDDAIVLRFLPDDDGVVSFHLSHPEWIAEPEKWEYIGDDWGLSVPTLNAAELRQVIYGE